MITSTQEMFDPIYGDYNPETGVTTQGMDPIKPAGSAWGHSAGLTLGELAQNEALWVQMQQAKADRLAEKTAQAASVADQNVEFAATVIPKTDSDEISMEEDAVSTINRLIDMLRSDGLEISAGVRLEVKAMTKNGRPNGRKIINPGAAGSDISVLCSSAVAIYRDSVDTYEVMDKIADIFGLLE